MIYEELATEWLIKMSLLRKEQSQKNINEAFQGEGLVLSYIANSSDYVLPGEIRQELNVTTARIATALNSLEKKGLVTRQIDPDDRRRILVRITQEGRRLAEKCQLEIKNAVTNMLALLGEHDAKEYVRITGKLAELVAGCKEMKS